MPQFFPTPRDFRRWLEKYHATERELIVGFHRRESGKPSITWPESVEEALCFGWIDGIRRKHDDHSYTIRFTPRKQTSIWSQKNLATMKRLIGEGRVTPAGQQVYEKPATSPRPTVTPSNAMPPASLPSRNARSEETRRPGSSGRRRFPPIASPPPGGSSARNRKLPAKSAWKRSSPAPRKG